MENDQTNDKPSTVFNNVQINPDFMGNALSNPRAHKLNVYTLPNPANRFLDI